LLKQQIEFKLSQYPNIHWSCGAEITNGSYLIDILAKYMPITTFQWEAREIIVWKRIQSAFILIV
jgi:hypothetical protein